MNKSEKIKMKIDKNRRAGKPVDDLQKELIKEVEKQFTQISFFVDSRLHKEFKIICAIKGQTATDVLTKHIKSIIKNHKS